MTGEHGESRGGEAQLYVVATPIGNLEDIGRRALRILAEVDVIAAEDTRTSGVLLRHYGVGARLMALHQHNEARAAEQVLALLREGKRVALVSDAGTPGVSDPGTLLAARVRAAGFPVTPIPGPNAAIAAVSVSGMAEDGFVFLGFLPPRRAARRSAIGRLRALPWPLVFHEAPHRVVEAIEDLAAGLGAERRVLITRELTKRFEQIHECALGDAAAWLAEDANRQRGEFVLVVGGAGVPAPDTDADAARLDPVLDALLAELPLAQSVRLACAITGAKKNAVYARALERAGHRKV